MKLTLHIELGIKDEDYLAHRHEIREAITEMAGGMDGGVWDITLSGDDEAIHCDVLGFLIRESEPPRPELRLV